MPLSSVLKVVSCIHCSIQLDFSKSLFNVWKCNLQSFLTLPNPSLFINTPSLPISPKTLTFHWHSFFTNLSLTPHLSLTLLLYQSLPNSSPSLILLYQSLRTSYARSRFYRQVICYNLLTHALSFPITDRYPHTLRQSICTP